MGAYSGLEEKRKQLVRYIRNNPTATYKKIKEDTKIKVERVFPKGMKDVYRAANIPFPKALRKRTKDQMLNEVIEFIRNNPTTANTVTIKRGLGIHISRTFKTIKKAKIQTWYFREIFSVIKAPNTDVVKTVTDRNLQENWKF